LFFLSVSLQPSHTKNTMAADERQSIDCAVSNSEVPHCTIDHSWPAA